MDPSSWIGSIYVNSWLNNNLFSFVTCGTSSSLESNNNNNWTSLLDPFPVKVWVLLLGTTSFITFCVGIRMALTKLRISCYLVLNLWIDCWAVLLRVSSIPVKIVVNSFWLKSVCVFWLFVGILISNLYEAKVTQLMIMEPEFDCPEDLESLIRSNYTILVLLKFPGEDYHPKLLSALETGIYDIAAYQLYTSIWSFFFRYSQQLRTLCSISRAYEKWMLAYAPKRILCYIYSHKLF